MSNNPITEAAREAAGKLVDRFLPGYQHREKVDDRFTDSRNYAWVSSKPLQVERITPFVESAIRQAMAKRDAERQRVVVAILKDLASNQYALEDPRLTRAVLEGTEDIPPETAEVAKPTP